MRPGSPGWRGYVDVGALELYCERHGDGHPLVLLHGAFGTIESCFADLVPALARNFEVIAVELQGHWAGACPAVPPQTGQRSWPCFPARPTRAFSTGRSGSPP